MSLFAFVSASLGTGGTVGLIMLVCFTLVFLIRKKFGTAWEKLFSQVDPGLDQEINAGGVIVSKFMQSLPSVLIGTVIGTVTSGAALAPALLGALGGLLAAFAHEFAKAIPFIPYTGSTGSSKLPGPSKPPTGVIAALCIAMALSVTGCGLVNAAFPVIAEAGVLIADAVNAVDAAQALIPSLNLSAAEDAKIEADISKCRQFLAAAAAADNGAKDLTEAQLDASLADFRAAWADLESAFAAKQKASLCEGCLFLPEPLAVKRVNK